MERVDKRKEIGDYVFISKYARTINGRKETWEESVKRVMDMHREKLGSLLDQPRLKELFERAENLYIDQRVLGAQRALQFGGAPMFKHVARQYNCAGSYVNRVKFYKELMYLLLCGVGVGYSVQKCHTNQLPVLLGVDRSKPVRNICIEDSVEGWSLSVDSLIKSHYYNEAPVSFDFSKIRKKGSFISGGFRAPGPEPLMKCLEKMDKLLQRWRGRQLTPFELHRLACVVADAVISGGVRRAALLCQFDADDQDMISCKTGEWWSEMPELCRANNAAVILPSTSKEVYDNLFECIKQFGEPSVIFSPDQQIVYNPCCFTGETLVAVADGRNAVTIKELAESGADVPIYYKNKKGKVCIANGRAFYTGERRVVKVVLSNGSVVNCTPDHPLQTINGDYIAAGESEGVVLSKFFSSTKRKYRTINSFTNGYARQYRMIWEFYNGEKPEGQEIDHIDNSVGDFIDNLQLLPLEEHLRKTGDERRGENNPVHKVSPERRSETAKAVNFLQNNARYSGLSNRDLIEIGREVIRRGDDLTRKNCKAVNDCFPAGFSKNRFEGSWPLYKKYVLGELEYHDVQAPTYNPKEEISLDYLAEQVYVVSVIDEGKTEEVYDIEMECPEHNFAIITKGDNTYGNSEGVFVHNCEVSGYPQCEIDGKESHGFFFCNLTEINGAKVKTKQQFLEACEAAAVIGTIQASWTEFNDILDPASRFIAERDALLGVGMTGMCENPDLFFDEEFQKEGAEVVKKTNREVAKLLGINFAARCTVIKPSGNSSQMLGCTSSGISPFHFRRMIRNIQAANTEQAFQYFSFINPDATEPAAYDKENTSVVSFPVELDDNVLVRGDLSAVDFLKLIKLTKENWIEHGTNLDHQFYKEHPELNTMRMNVSNTCTVREDEWDEVKAYIWDNKNIFAGISFLPEGGDLLYPQAPYTSVLDEIELAQKYGPGSILAGGLIMDALDAFDGDLWEACDTAMGRNRVAMEFSKEEVGKFIVDNLTDKGLLVDIKGVKVSDVNAIHSFLKEKNEKKKNWVRRFKSFSEKYLHGDMSLTENCIKHVHLYHKWQNLKNMKNVDWSSLMWEINWEDIDTMTAQGCSGGACELK